jgi:hypothetical protein
VIEEPAHQLARGEQAGDRLAVGALDLALVVILSPPKVKVRPQVTA